MSPRIRVWAAGVCAAAIAGTLEPADDYTAISLLAFAYGTDGRD